MEFKGITTSALLYKKCSTENPKIIYLIRGKDGKLIPEEAELERFEGGTIEFSYGSKTIFKRTKRIIIEDCFPDRSKLIVKRQRIGNNGVSHIWGISEREIEDISVMRLSEAKKDPSSVFLKGKDLKRDQDAWVYVLSLKPLTS